MTRKRTDDLGRAFAGSQLQIQTYVNRRLGELNRAIIDASPDLASRCERIDWVSPIEADLYREYWDTRFLEVLGLAGLGTALESFWPRRGPHWDALARVVLRGGHSGVLLLEAKSHIAEMRVAGGSAASDPASVAQIHRALKRTQAQYGVAADRDWNGPLFQMANRLAHLQFLKDQKVPTWLVLACFEDDSTISTPTGEAAWRQALQEAWRELGLRNSPVPDVLEIVLPARSHHELFSELDVDAVRLREAEAEMREARREVEEGVRAHLSEAELEKRRARLVATLGVHRVAVEALLAKKGV